MSRLSKRQVLGLGVYFLVVGMFWWPDYWLIGSWLVGGGLSLALEYVDRILHVYLIRPEEHLSQQVRFLVREKRYRQAGLLLGQRASEQRYLLSRSVVFMVVFIPFGWYVLSSTGSMLAAGLIMGLGGQLMLLVAGFWGKWSKMGQELFWVVKRPMTDREVMMVVGIYGIFFGWFSLQLMGV